MFDCLLRHFSRIFFCRRKWFTQSFHVAVEFSSLPEIEICCTNEASSNKMVHCVYSEKNRIYENLEPRNFRVRNSRVLNSRVLNSRVLNSRVLKDRVRENRVADWQNGKLNESYYRAFHRFGLPKMEYVGLVLGSSKFLLLTKLPQKWSLLQKWSKSTRK